MKTFGEVKVNDKIYLLDDDFRIREIYICGVEDFQLRHEDVFLKSLNGKMYQAKAKETTSTIDDKVVFFSCLEAAQQNRERLKNFQVKKQMDIAMRAFRRMKKIDRNLEANKKRVLNFFEMLERDEENMS